jgi:hypothetical protein
MAEEPHKSLELKSEVPPLELHADLCIRSIMISNDEGMLISVPAEIPEPCLCVDASMHIVPLSHLQPCLVLSMYNIV